MTATPERARTIAFSDPYLNTGLCLLAGKNSPIQKHRGRRSSRARPGRQDKAPPAMSTPARRSRRAQVLVLDTEAACVLEVVQGKADGFIYDQISTYENWRRNPETTRAILQPFQQESWAIGLRQDDSGIARGRSTNSCRTTRRAAASRNWATAIWSEQKEAFRKLGYPFFFERALVTLFLRLQ